jgi:two-component system LytT family response regulator
MKAIIIENEITASRLLTKIIDDYCPLVQVVGTAVSIRDEFQLLNAMQPDLVFLDIELDDEQRFELFDMMEKHNFKVIFTTALDQYGLKAFRYDAVDYILKPNIPNSSRIR